MITLLAILFMIGCVTAPILLFATAVAIVNKLLGVDFQPSEMRMLQRPLEDEIIKAQWRYDNIFKGKKQ